MRLLLIDNYDSFTHNLAQLFGVAGAEVMVVRNTVPLAELQAVEPDALLISPGPGTPKDAGVSSAALLYWYDRIPVFGVCLGMQLINEAFGGATVHAPRPVHGKATLIRHDGTGVLATLPSPLLVARYHSLAVQRNSDTLIEQAWSDDGIVMALRHTTFEVHAVQFHPESFLTDQGLLIARNFLSIVEHSGTGKR